MKARDIVLANVKILDAANGTTETAGLTSVQAPVSMVRRHVKARDIVRTNVKILDAANGTTEIAGLTSVQTPVMQEMFAQIIRAHVGSLTKKGKKKRVVGW